jgi:hypothetical protein
VVALVLQIATWLELAHQPDELGANRGIRLVVFMDPSDRRHGGGLDLALWRQSITGCQRRLRDPLRGDRFVTELREHFHRANTDKHRCRILRLAAANKINGQLAQAAGNVIDCVPHRAGA